MKKFSKKIFFKKVFLYSFWVYIYDYKGNLEKKIFFETAKKNRKGPPLRFWVKNHRREIKKFPQKSKCTLKS